MVIRQALFGRIDLSPVFSFLRGRRRAAPIAVGVSIGIHLAIVVWLVQSNFHPFALPSTPDPTPPTVVTTWRLPPPARQAPRIPPPRSITHVPPSAPHTLDTAPLPQPIPEPPSSTSKVDPLTPSVPDPPGIVVVTPPPPPVTITNPDWISRPNAAQFAHAYPEDAARRGLSGSSILACEVTLAGTVADCDVVSESPAGYGFGKAGLSLTKWFKLRPRLENGQAVGGASVRIPIRFAMAKD